ncbi:hypothetical protein Ssi03_26070 [Sphaerisporangium siamense]|uniref:Uncharacterized protein n=1 Tax=Sphaerisporangium siamense TaxID=795645 RepID=A0A7W7D4B2_9ACTN|nr:hypothetical protein [Sphaerisporangium siamense]MBB4700065.1 hypothetical protein [Sphaerisporangium siamense]GII84617.1 hypothetical protein Ssi03_26070 [Sphaerisporangium siamense]
MRNVVPSGMTVEGWALFVSDAGRYWATRVKPFSDAEGTAGAWRTVDADDERTLALEIAEQESLAALATLGDEQ